MILIKLIEEVAADPLLGALPGADLAQGLRQPLQVPRQLPLPVQGGQDPVEPGDDIILKIGRLGQRDDPVLVRLESLIFGSLPLAPA
ncbi:hypothetical protein GCM10007416_07780 [Kroppenstedtia guangzhouensis]|uniref:Uncharacterized protein n=1 Tax=Kroppenstedtia guangzhouensis TaxID=1274356 RepID=A0ABQ1G5T2_9BACL|nr:hypothetical protein GCM10007416_07780 [Kroppenstedtia guangzhouensis]